jgi:hypothetical protein
MKKLKEYADFLVQAILLGGGIAIGMVAVSKLAALI